jgi:hypothetical protein
MPHARYLKAVRSPEDISDSAYHPILYIPLIMPLMVINSLINTFHFKNL